MLKPSQSMKTETPKSVHHKFPLANTLRAETSYSKMPLKTNYQKLLYENYYKKTEKS